MNRDDNKILNIYNLYNMVMPATKRIRLGQTFDQLLGELMEKEKKYRLIQDMKKIEEEEEFVELDL